MGQCGWPTHLKFGKGKSDTFPLRLNVEFNIYKENIINFFIYVEFDIETERECITFNFAKFWQN